MPKLQDYRVAFYEFTGKVSDNVRALALASVAIVWVFKIQDDKTLSIPDDLQMALFMSVAALGFDFLQYLVNSFIWYCFYRSKEIEGCPEEKEVYSNEWWNVPGYLFFLLKIICLFISYYNIAAFFLEKLTSE